MPQSSMEAATGGVKIAIGMCQFRALLFVAAYCVMGCLQTLMNCQEDIMEKIEEILCTRYKVWLQSLCPDVSTGVFAGLQDV